MIGKQSKGRGFRGALNYVLGKEGAEIVGGNMLGQNAKELASEFALSRELKPNLSRVVYHASLSLPPGENLTDGHWSEVAERYMEGMGFKGAQFVAVKHTDTYHSHIHIIASRVRMDGSVVSESHDYRRSETQIRGLEQEFGLTPTAPSRDAASRAPTTGELQKGLRERKPSTRLTLQNVINQAARGRPTMSEFVSRLEGRNVAVIPNIAKTGHLSGISFRLDGEMMKGSDLGRSFTWQGLQKRGVNYDENRDFQRISQARIVSADHVRHWTSDGPAAQGGPREYQGTKRYDQASGRSYEHLGAKVSASHSEAGRQGDQHDERRKQRDQHHRDRATENSRVRDGGRGAQGDRSAEVHRNGDRARGPQLDCHSEHVLRLAVAALGHGQKGKELGSVRESRLAPAESTRSGHDHAGIRIIEQALKPLDDEREKELHERQEERKKLDLERRKNRARDRSPDLGR